MTELKIADNPFAYTQEKRTELITAIFNKVKGFKYLPFKFKYISRPYIDPFDEIIVKDMEDVEHQSYLFNHKLSYNGGLSATIETEAQAKSETQYLFTPTVEKAIKTAEIKVDKALGEITSIITEQTSITTKIVNLEQTSEKLEVAVKKSGGNNLILNSVMLNGTTNWLVHLVITYIESDTPPTENLFEGKYWYCTKNIETYEMGYIYEYTSGVWVKTGLTKKYIDNASNLMLYTSQLQNDDSRKYTISNSIQRRNAGENLDVSHIFNATNVIDVVDGQEDVTLSFKLNNKMQLGVGYIALRIFR